MPVSFVRNLGRAPGVQLNPLVDNSQRATRLIGDRSFGIPMRTTRGRIDRAFSVEFNTLQQKLGPAETIRMNALNEARAQLHEALAISGGSAVVSRLVRADQAHISWAVLVRSDPVEPATANVFTYGTSADAIVEEDNAIKNAAGADLPAADAVDCVLRIKHLECHNDGISVSVWAEPVSVGGVDQSTNVLHVRVSDADNRALIYVVGSTNPDAKDDYGRSYYLPDVFARLSDAYEVEVVPNFAFAPDDALYGYNLDGRENRLTSALLSVFTEGDTAYVIDDYQLAIDRLYRANDDFAYLASGGSQSAALLLQLSRLAFETNRQFRFDVPGTLGVESAIAFVESLNMQAVQEAHLMQAFWAPVKSIDPSGVNPDGYFGTAMLNIAMACRRNITTNTKGLAPKHYPIAGRSHPVPRSGLRQTVALGEMDLNSLERMRINPVVFDAFSDGSFCVFRDQVTQAPVDNSLRKIISVVDMATDIDDRVTRFAKDLINSFPMSTAALRMSTFLQDLFSAAEASGWLIPSEDMAGAAFMFSANPNGERPYDMLDVRYTLRYEGAVRQIEVTQTLSR